MKGPGSDRIPVASPTTNKRAGGVRSNRGTAGAITTLRKTNKISGDSAVAWEKFKNSIAKFARTNDRRMMIRILKDCPRLRIIPLEPIDTSCLLRNQTDLADVHLQDQHHNWRHHAEQEVSQSVVRMNGMALSSSAAASKHHHSSGSSASHNHRTNKSHVAKSNNNRELLEILRKLCCHLAGSSGASSDHIAASADEMLYDEILLRLVRSKASTDAYHQLSELLGSSDLVVQPPKKAAPLPTDVTLYRSDDGRRGSGDIHAVAVTRHPYGLFRKTDLSGTTSASISYNTHGSKRPWVRLIASVHERVNLSTGESVRYCSVNVQDKL